MSGDLSPILDNLREHWGDPYHIWFDDSLGKFGAIPRKGPIEDPLYADTAEGLRELIREDYEKENRSGPGKPDLA